MRVLRRRRYRWNTDVVAVVELGPPVATSSTEVTAVLQVAELHLVRHRRRWGRVR